jgi:hypothetical protein
MDQSPTVATNVEDEPLLGEFTLQPFELIDKKIGAADIETKDP